MADAPVGKEFVFSMPDGTVVGRAKNLNELCNLVKTAPLEAVLFHAKDKHFTPWLRMIGKRKAARNIDAVVIHGKTARVAILRALRA
jgi:hypothetical protein